MSAGEKAIIIDVADGTQIPAIVTEVDPSVTRREPTVLLAHGIFSEKNERGRFARQAQMLRGLGLTSLRFDFRGHGDHRLSPQEVTISGMLLDFATVLRFMKTRFHGPIYLVASSFGGSISLLYMQADREHGMKRIVLLNPVVDYVRTFISPLGSDMHESFGPKQWQELEDTGYMHPNPGFKMSETFVLEMKVLKPYTAFDTLTAQTLVLHGSEDKSVPYEFTMTYSLRSPGVTFNLIEGADHAFAEPHEERQTFELIADWLTRDERH